MLTTSMGFYLQVPNDPRKNFLNPGLITHVDGDMHSAEVEISPELLQPGGEIKLFFDHRRNFMQQSATVSAILSESTVDAPENSLGNTTRTKITFTFQTQGKPVSAESRQSFRVSTISAELTARVDQENDCPLLDISSTGFSVISAKEFQTGAQITVAIEHDENKYSGAACIQSKREFGKNQFRYGLHALDDKKLGGNLMLGMQMLSMIVQRQQLQRLSGAA